MVPYEDSLSFDRTIYATQNQTKFNNSKVLDKHKMVPRNKARMAILMCQMMSMPIIHLALKIDILKMEKAFQTCYREGYNFSFMFYLSIGRARGIPSTTCLLGINIGYLRMRDLSLSCLSILTSSLSPCTCFFVWDGNHKLQAWVPYINLLHNDEPSQYISIDCIVLDIFHGLVEPLIAMTKFNKYVFEPSFFSYMKLDLNDFFFIIFCIFASWWSQTM